MDNKSKDLFSNLEHRASPRKVVRVCNYHSGPGSSFDSEFQKEFVIALEPGRHVFKRVKKPTEVIPSIHKYGCHENHNTVGYNTNSDGYKKFLQYLTDFNMSIKGYCHESRKILKMKSLLESECSSLRELRNLCWSGIPWAFRSETWKLLVGYAPERLARREKALQERRRAYWSRISRCYSSDPAVGLLQDTYKQILMDVPRMSPAVGLLREKAVQDTFTRVLYVWAVEHPAIRYLQGMNDLVTPFFLVFLSHLMPEETDLEKITSANLGSKNMSNIEADTYCCFSKFVEHFQENYLHPRLGIQRSICEMKELVKRIDLPLHNHLEANGVEYVLFAFRWMNNLLTRELPIRCQIRLWDTFLAELDDFRRFLLFVCVAFLLRWKGQLLLEVDFQGLMLFVQNLPTQAWDDSDVDLLVAEAFRLKSTFADAPHHFRPTSCFKES